MKTTTRTLIRLYIILATLAGMQAKAEEVSQTWVADFTNDDNVRVGVSSESLATESFPQLASLVSKGLTLHSFSAVLNTDYEESEKGNYTFRYIIRYRGLDGGKTKTTYARGGFATSLPEAYDLAVKKFKVEETELRAEHEALVFDSISIIRERIAPEAEQEVRDRRR